jgi:hypothetical protein
MNWIQLAQDRDQRRDLMNTVMTFVFHGIFWLVNRLSNSQEGLCSMELGMTHKFLIPMTLTNQNTALIFLYS